MSSPRAAVLDLPQGAQRPRHLWVPDYVSSSGEEAIELARMAGLDLDPWQELVLAHSLGERADHKWAAFEVGLIVPRQNGKGSLLEARELAGLFILDERLLIHSAHQFDTSLEAFRRLLQLIEDTPDLDRRVQRVSKSHGEEGIELKKNLRTGLRQRIRFRTRTKGGGRGFTGDLLVLDEAMIIPESGHAALLPTLSARPNPQVWYTGSAVDQDVHEHGIVLTRLRERGIKGGDPRLMYADWCAPFEHPDDVTEEAASDPENWAAANPALGIRITPEYVETEQRALSARGFAVERLGVGDWPSLEDVGDGISVEAWKSCADEKSVPIDPVCFAFDVRPDRSSSAIAVAGYRADGKRHVEIVEHKSGTAWVVKRLVELTGRNDCGPIIFDQKSPAAALLTELVEAGVRIEVVGPNEQAQGCGMLLDAVNQDAIRHLGTPELLAAVKGAVKRPLGDAWAWSRKSSSVDISPLVSCTLALWGLGNTGPVLSEPLVAWR